MITAFLFLSAFVQVYWLYRLMKKSDEYERRIKALESSKPEPKNRVQATVPPKQVFEKPIVKNAKEVKPLEIGDGRMRFDSEAQIAEWI